LSLSLLFRDELNGFYRSKVMLVLWVGMPALSVFIYLLSPDTGTIPVAVFTSFLVGSIGGTLSSAMLAVSIINERERHVFDLFVIRPVRRRNILLSKFLAVYLCVVVAGLLALALGVLVDQFVTGLSGGFDLSGFASSTIVLLSMLAVSCSAGILIGTVSPSVLVGVILVLYGGNQLSSVALLPVLLLEADMWFPLIPGVAISAALLTLSIIVFDRKQL
jgi:ABC-2 type transport system permease protein